MPTHWSKHVSNAYRSHLRDNGKPLEFSRRRFKEILEAAPSTREEAEKIVAETDMKWDVWKDTMHAPQHLRIPAATTARLYKGLGKSMEETEFDVATQLMDGGFAKKDAELVAAYVVGRAWSKKR